MKEIIIYTSKHGCTKKAVMLLESKLSKKIETINLAVEQAPDLSSYDTVILGGPIYVGKIPKELSTYIHQNMETLKRKRLALFLCAGEQDPVLIQKLLTQSFTEELYKKAFMKEALGGELHLSQLSFFTRLMLRLIKGINKDYNRLSEEKIEMLAKEICL